MKTTFDQIQTIEKFSIRNFIKELYAESINEDDVVSIEVIQTSASTYKVAVDSENDEIHYGIHDRATVTITDNMPIMYDSCPVEAIFDMSDSNADAVIAFEIVDNETGEIRVVHEYK